MRARRVAIVAMAASLAGCGGSTLPGGPPPLSPSTVAALSAQVPPQVARFVADLRGTGANIYAVEVLRPESSFAWIPVPATRILVGGDRLHAFEYATVEDVEAALLGTSPDAQEFASAQVFWLSDPHIYRRDRMIVLYVGTSRGILELLTRFLGPQVAGV